VAGLVIDASSPAVATQATGTTATVTSASFTPPANSLLVIRWSGNTAAGSGPAQPTITDNLGTPLTYHLTDWQSRADPAGADGQSATWWANVASSAAMTVTVTNQAASGNRQAGMKILVFTDTNGQPTTGAHGKSGGTASSIAQSYTAQATGGWGLIGVCDWDVIGAETAGTGCTLTDGGSANIGTAITYGFLRRTTADDVNTNSNTLNVTIPGTSTNLSWTYVEVLPAVAAAGINWLAPRTVPISDYGEVQWLQQSRRNIALFATAANDLASPLLIGAGSNQWHAYNDAADAGQRTWQGQQRVFYDSSLLAPGTDPLGLPSGTRYCHAAAYVDRRMMPQQRAYTDPSLLASAELEGALLGGGDTARRYLAPANAARWWMPQQPVRAASSPGLLDFAELEPPLLGQADINRHSPAAYTDRRLVPQQRSYISPSGLLATALLDELLGSADTGRHTTWFTDRRLYPTQRIYVSDPLLLTTALLENELLGGATAGLRRMTAAYQVDRREMPQQRVYASDPSFYPPPNLTDPLTLAYGAGGSYWWLYNTAAAQVDRRLAPQQRRYVSDPALLATALLDELLGQGDVGRHATWFTDRREVPQQRTYQILPTTALLELELLGSGDTARHLAWFADRREVPAQRTYTDLGLFAAPPIDPLTLAAGVGGDMWRRVNAPAYADRREIPQQPPRATLYFDAGPASPPLTLAWGAGGNLWHVYNWRRPARDRWPWRFIYAPTVIADVKAFSASTVTGRVTGFIAVTGVANMGAVAAGYSSAPAATAHTTSADAVTAHDTSDEEVT
jgi:hypothetical protein